MKTILSLVIVIAFAFILRAIVPAILVPAIEDDIPRMAAEILERDDLTEDERDRIYTAQRSWPVESLEDRQLVLAKWGTRSRLAVSSGYRN